VLLFKAEPLARRRHAGWHNVIWRQLTVMRGHLVSVSRKERRLDARL
jgi:hypothetical protein